MDNRVKVFWSFDELDKDQKIENYNFEDLNTFLENNPNISVWDINDSYIKVLLEEDFDANKLEYSQLDFLVKKLVEDSWEAVNSILGFIEFKYPQKQKLLKDTFDEYFLIPEDTTIEIVETIIEKRIWYMNLSNGLDEWKIYFDFENFDFLEALNRLRTSIEKQIKG